MLHILIKDQTAINIDSTEECDRLTQDGWRELSSAEIKAAGMEGYEQFVSPTSTTVKNGVITFTPPAGPTEDELFTRLRSERDALLALTDYYVMPDYPAEDKSAVLAYRQALRDLPAQPGAPWDGGGEKTPWPAKPEL